MGYLPFSSAGILLHQEPISFGKFLAVGAFLARCRIGGFSWAGMQLLGAWMIETPRSRALAILASMRGAISLSRSTARLQLCRSHISRVMIAVLLGSHGSGCCFTSYFSGAVVEGTRLRRM